MARVETGTEGYGTITTEEDLTKCLKEPLKNIEKADELNNKILDLFIDKKIEKKEVARFSIKLAYKADIYAASTSKKHFQNVKTNEPLTLILDEVQHARNIAKECRDRAFKATTVTEVRIPN